MGNPAPGQFRNGLDCLPGARRIEQKKTVKATESDEVKSFRFLEPFQTIRHGPIMARYAPGYLIFDRGTQFNEEVIETMKDFGIQPMRTSFRSPWQNGVAERWVGNCCRDLLDHVIVLNERHLKRLMNEYVHYYHDDRTHLALAKETPAGRETEANSGASSKVIAMPRLGGLHHRYDLAA